MSIPFTPNQIQLKNIAFDPEYTPGAYNAVNVCLRVQPSEKVCVITDEATVEIAAAVAAELDKLGVNFRAWVLEELAPRPLKDFPAAIAEDLETSQVSIFAAQAQPNELKSRMQMTDVVNRRRIRHAHMVNINRRIMMEGMRADFAKVDEISVRVREIASSARAIRARTAAARILSSIRRSSKIHSSAASPGRSTRNRRGSAVNGPIVSRMPPHASDSWREQLAH